MLIFDLLELDVMLPFFGVELVYLFVDIPKKNLNPLYFPLFQSCLHSDVISFAFQNVELIPGFFFFIVGAVKQLTLY